MATNGNPVQNNIENPETSVSALESSVKKFLFVSLESLSGDLAWQVKKEGHEVKAYIKAKSDEDVYSGFIERVNAWEDYQDWADVIVFDDVGFGAVAEKLRAKGKFVIGGSV